MCSIKMRFKRIRNELLDHLEINIIEKLKDLISLGIDLGYNKLKNFINKGR